MATTINIPLTTLQPGSRVFGPASLADSDTLAVLTIDRTPANGFNSLDSGTTADIMFEQSNDSGATWIMLTEATFTGGIFIRRGVQVDTDDCGAFLRPGTSRQGRGTVTIAGTAVAVQGSLAIT